ncbi:MAG: hypothetical protein ISQ32_02200 [Rickettsiales bacterium]|nr:hypothetical protein [Rickettsiales bacterium]
MRANSLDYKGGLLFFNKDQFFINNIFTNNVNHFTQDKLNLELNSFIDNNEQEIIKYASLLKNTLSIEQIKLVNLIAGVADQSQLNDLYCDAEVCFIFKTELSNEDQIVLQNNFEKNIPDIKNLLLKTNQVRIPFPNILNTEHHTQYRKNDVCTPVRRPGLVPVSQWDPLDFQFKLADKNSSDYLGFTTSPSESDTDRSLTEGTNNNVSSDTGESPSENSVISVKSLSEVSNEANPSTPIDQIIKGSQGFVNECVLENLLQLNANHDSPLIGVKRGREF